jgi:hypothetical protein
MSYHDDFGNDNVDFVDYNDRGYNDFDDLNKTDA